MSITMKEPTDFIIANKNKKTITLFEQNIMNPACKKNDASITNKLFIRFTDKSPGHSSSLYFSAKPQIGHSVRRSYLD
jgi:hypothetical protein